MTTDKFWKTYWIIAVAIVVMGIGSGVVLLFTQKPGSELVAAVGATYSPNEDPFASTTLHAEQNPALLRGELYRDALPLQFRSWSWQGTGDWRSTQQKYEGSRSLRAIFNEQGGTVGMSGTLVDSSKFHSISLMVRPDSNVGDIYLEMLDTKGKSGGIQSLAWYKGGALTPNVWQEVTVPLQNLLRAGTNGITGFSISTKKGGVVYVDKVELKERTISRQKWVEPVPPPQQEWQPYDPFATSSSLSLPYTVSFTPEGLRTWHTFYGSFALSQGALRPGSAQGGETKGSMSVLRGGKNWSNYHIYADVDWGEMTSFSLLLRVQDDANYLSCAFSKYGDVVLLYETIRGKSRVLAERPWRRVDTKPILWTPLALEAEIRGSKVSCYVNGRRVATAETSLAGNGTAGVATWDEGVESLAHKVRSFKVMPLNI